MTKKATIIEKYNWVKSQNKSELSGTWHDHKGRLWWIFDTSTHADKPSYMAVLVSSVFDKEEVVCQADTVEQLQERLPIYALME